MTIREMQRNFMIKLRQFIEEPEVESDDIEYYLNRAQEEYVKQQHLIIKDNIRNESLSNRAIQSAIENLRTLIKSKTFHYTADALAVPAIAKTLAASTEIDNGLVIALDDDALFPEGSEYAYYLRSRLTPNTPSGAINCRIIDTNNLSKFTKTKYNYPLFREPAVLIEGETLTIIYPVDFEDEEGAVRSDTKYYLTYITYPTEMSIQTPTDCTLPIHTHNEIVDLAVNNKIEDLQKSRQIGFDKSYKSAPRQTTE
jgi:hypothetical protein